jgi:hypothetical protein
MPEERCRFGETERSCEDREFPKCGDGGCELHNRPRLKKFINSHK